MNSGILEHNLVDRNETLYRGISQFYIKREDEGIYRISSGAYKTVDVSVDLASKTTPETSVKSFAALAGLTAACPIDLGYKVVEDALPDNPAHALILGKVTSGDAKKMANVSHWVVPPLKL